MQSKLGRFIKNHEYVTNFDFHDWHFINFGSYDYPKIPRKSTCSKDSESVKFEGQYLKLKKLQSIEVGSYSWRIIKMTWLWTSLTFFIFNFFLKLDRIWTASISAFQIRSQNLRIVFSFFRAVKNLKRCHLGKFSPKSVPLWLLMKWVRQIVSCRHIAPSTRHTHNTITGSVLDLGSIWECMQSVGYDTISGMVCIFPCQQGSSTPNESVYTHWHSHRHRKA